MPIHSLLLVLVCVAGPWSAIPAADTVDEASLLDRIIAAQQGIERMTATLRYEVHDLKEPDGRVNAQQVRAWLRMPRSYYLIMKPFKADGSLEERKAYFMSDGETIWQGERELADMEVDVFKPKPVDPEENDLGSYVALLKLGRGELAERFAMTAETLPDDVERSHPEAVHRVTLKPQTAALQKHIAQVLIEVDAALQTVAIAIDDTKENRTILRIEAVDTEVPLPEDIFVWKFGEP